MKLFTISLTQHGKDIFKGANIEVMQRVLDIKIEAPNRKKAIDKFYSLLIRTGGSSQLLYYEVVKP